MLRTVLFLGFERKAYGFLGLSFVFSFGLGLVGSWCNVVLSVEVWGSRGYSGYGMMVDSHGLRI